MTDKALCTTSKTLPNVNELTEADWTWWHHLPDIWKKIFTAHIYHGDKDSDLINIYGVLQLLEDQDLYQVIQLDKLYYSYNYVMLNDISSLAHLKQLTELSLRDNYIQDISALANLTQLTELYLSDNKIKDISALAHLKQLTELSLRDNYIQDISALENLTQLTELGLSDNKVQDISPLANLIQLTKLDLQNNQIQDISALANLTQLTYLNLEANPIPYSQIEWLKLQLPNCNIHGRGIPIANLQFAMKLTEADWEWWNNLSDMWKRIFITHIYDWGTILVNKSYLT